LDKTVEEEAVGEDFDERKERIAAADCLRRNTFGGSYCFVPMVFRAKQEADQRAK
jgi:hypothetical protein